MYIILDLDPIVYRAGFAAETTHYHIVYEHESGEMEEVYFKKTPEKSAGDLMKEWIKEHPGEVLSKDKDIDVEPLNFALRGVKLTVDACIKDIEREMGCKAKDVIGILSGPGNFREKLATIKPYKGNRDPDHKPTHYQAIRNYLCEYYNARVVHGHEADDECSILAAEFRNKKLEYCIATIDKDLDQIPGWHYNYQNKDFYPVEQDEAELFFWKQVLTGDGVDNIQGLYRVSDKKASELMEHMIEHTPFVGSTEWWEAVIALYKANIEKYPDKYPKGISPRAAALENSRLVWMQTEADALWMPPGEEYGSVEEYIEQLEDSPEEKSYYDV